jgi:hypothetical protein
MAIDSNDNLYVAFRDAEDNTLKLATGQLTPERQDSAAKTEEKHEVPPKKD